MELHFCLLPFATRCRGTIGVPSCPLALARLIFPKWFRPISGFSNNFSPPTTDLPHSPLNSHLRPWHSEEPVRIMVSNVPRVSATSATLFYQLTFSDTGQDNDVHTAVTEDSNPKEGISLFSVIYVQCDICTM